MINRDDVLRILRDAKPDLIRKYRIKRLALFGSFARDEQTEDSDVDILVDVEPSIGLGFVELSDRIEEMIGVRTEVVSRRAIKSRAWEFIQKELVDVP